MKRNDLNTYKFTLKHDKGKQVIKVRHYTLEGAKRQIIFFENCPECAIELITTIRPKQTKQQKDKMYQFVRLCTELTKQGLKFDREKSVAYALVFDKVSAKRLLSSFTKTPFVNSFIRISGDKTRECYQFEQWAGRN
mgnify:CR=1 FL=1